MRLFYTTLSTLFFTGCLLGLAASAQAVQSGTTESTASGKPPVTLVTCVASDSGFCQNNSACAKLDKACQPHADGKCVCPET